MYRPASQALIFERKSPANSGLTKVLYLLKGEPQCPKDIVAVQSVFVHGAVPEKCRKTDIACLFPLADP